MCQLLDGRVADLEIGAFALAMRIKGESADELIGFLDAVHARCLTITAPRRAVLLPSYNGARKLPQPDAAAGAAARRRKACRCWCTARCTTPAA